MFTNTALELDAEGAVAWAAAHPGWYIFPGRMVPDGLGSWLKKPLVPWATRASKDPDEIRAMWEEVGGTAVICVSCAPSGIWVLDEDREPDGDWEAILGVVRDKALTLVLTSCTKGRPHYVFKQEPATGWVPEGRWEFGDVKATGMIMVSSREPLVDAPVAVAPAGLVARLAKGRPKGRSGRGLSSSEEMWSWISETPDVDDLVLTPPVAKKFLDIIIDRMFEVVDGGEHRRQAALGAVYAAALEATAGCYPAEHAYNEIRDAYIRLRTAHGESGHKGWSPDRSDDYDNMWASLVPAIRAGDLDEEISATRASILERYAPDPDETDESILAIFDSIVASSLADVGAIETAVPPHEEPASEGDPAGEAEIHIYVDPIPDRAEDRAPSSPPDLGSEDAAPARAWDPLPVAAPLPAGGSGGGDGPAPPVLASEAFWGPHGELVDALRGRTESADIGVLSSLIAFAGVALAGRAHFRIGVDTHGPNVYVLNIGASSAARKSSAVTLAQHVFYETDPATADGEPIHSTLASLWLPRNSSVPASGERLIHLWSPSKERVVDEDGNPTGEEREDWPERRIVFVEPEASALWKRARKDGSQLSDVFCKMWDQVALANLALTSGDAAVPADRHLAGFLGASTLYVARSSVLSGEGIDAKSGFGNRFIWFYLPDSGIDLPFGADLPWGAIREYRKRLGLHDGSLADVAGRGDGTGDWGTPTTFSPDAAELWAEVYGGVKRDKGAPGIVEGLCSRGESQVLRLSLNYWLVAGGRLDGTGGGVGVDALKAALAVWRYAKGSVEYIFSNVGGDERVESLRADLEARGGWAAVEELSNSWNRGTLARIIEIGKDMGIFVEGAVKIPGRRGRPPRAIALRTRLESGKLASESAGGDGTRGGGWQLADVAWS